MKILTFAANEESLRLLDTHLKTVADCGAVSENSGKTTPPEDSQLPEDLLVCWLTGSIEVATSQLTAYRRQASSRALVLAVGPWSNPGEIAPLLAAGADDYLPAPFSAEQLLLRVRVLESRVLRNSPEAMERRLQERSASLRKSTH